MVWDECASAFVYCEAPRTVMSIERYRAPLTTSSLVYGTPATGYRTLATPVQPPAAAPPNTCGPIMYRPVRSYHVKVCAFDQSLNTSAIPPASSSFVSATPAVPPASVALSGVNLLERRSALERGSPNREWLDESLSVPPAIRTALARLAPGGRGNQLTRHILAPVSEGSYSTLGYYDKRRVENNVRRFLEHIEEWWNENEESEVDLGKLFDKYVTATEKALGESQRRSGNGSSSCGVHEPIFRQRLTSLNLWPAGLGLGDKQEVFTSIVVPTAKALRGCSNAHRIPTLMTKSQFVERLVDVPFNVPDYPVPADKLTARHLSAGEVATYLAGAVLEADLKEHEVVGVGPSSRHKAVLKDFTACGLVSVEELQALLFAHIAVGREHARNPLRSVTRDGLFPLKIVEGAVMKIIRRTVSLLPEWRTRVPSAYRRYTREEEGGRASSTVVEPEFEPPATMPAQTRCIGDAGPVRMEEYRRYREGRVDASDPVALDWSSWRMPIADSPSKTGTRPADGAAGVECVNLEDSFGRGCEPGNNSFAVDGELDMVVLELHNECKGPFVLSMLVKCCREYIRLQSRKRRRRRFLGNMSDVDTILHQIVDNPTTIGYVVLNSDGIPVKYHDRMPYEKAVMYAQLISEFYMKAKKCMRELLQSGAPGAVVPPVANSGPGNDSDLTNFRLRTKEGTEIIAVTGAEYILVVVQNCTGKPWKWEDEEGGGEATGS
ncbi:putative aminopeptidase npepl1 [Perkinsus olseni]|uniref:Putative aminopeptidase npepl1 n=1 Tax=Perkinsus olseni TaxID=32597 RepID=A0A7J6QVK6_PEROL|nr:putative aminopeptidase npepl1 [Perkinsus olseni]